MTLPLGSVIAMASADCSTAVARRRGLGLRPLAPDVADSEKDHAGDQHDQARDGEHRQPVRIHERHGTVDQERPGGQARGRNVEGGEACPVERRAGGLPPLDGNGISGLSLQDTPSQLRGFEPSSWGLVSMPPMMPCPSDCSYRP